MKTIELTFPRTITPDGFKKLMEGAVSKNSEYEVLVTYISSSPTDHEYLLQSSSSEAFYMSGMVAANILAELQRRQLP